MPEKDKQMLEILLQDKGEQYRVVIDNDRVWVEDKTKDEEKEDVLVHKFTEFGYYFLKQVLEQLGLDADLC
jgi:hypothetical protein